MAGLLQAVAGFVGGAGSAVGEIAGDYAKTAIAKGAKLDILQVEAQIARDRDARLNDFNVSMERDVRQPFAREERTSAQDFTRGMETEVRQPFARESQTRGFQHTETMQAAQQTFQGEQNALQRDLTREQIRSQERVSAGNNSVALQVAKMGGSVRDGPDGNVVFIDKAGNAKPIMDPNNPNQSLKAVKDLTPAAKAYVETIKAQLVDLDRMEIAAMGDQLQIGKIAQRRAALTKQQLDVLTGGISAVSAAPSGSGVDWSKFMSSPAQKGPGPRGAAPATTSPTDTTSASTDAPSRLAELNAEYEKQGAEIGKGKRRNYDASLLRELAELTDRGPGEKAYLERERRGIMNNPMMR